MNSPTLRILCIDTSWPVASSAGFEIDGAATLEEAMLRQQREPAWDGVVLDGELPAHRDADIAALAADGACVVVLDDADGAAAGEWLARGADDVIGRDELAAAPTSCARRLRFAVERRRRDGARSLAYSTDSATGLPHRQQLVEHLSQMLALREREEPSPMAVIVLRIEGGATGGDAGAAEPLRRKLAVRLRAGVRASDVVAAVDADTFAVLLGAILAPGDAERVAAKLAQSLMAPIPVGGGEREVAVAVGIGRYPQDGSDAERLLRRAVSLAAVAPASGRAGPATVVDGAGAARVAANDDGA